MANPKAPPIKVTGPAYGRKFGDDEAITLEWKTGQGRALRVQISSEPTFPETNRVEFPTRGGRSMGTYQMTLNRHERMLVSSVMNDAEGGQVYWRVVEPTRGSSSAAQSDVSRFGRE